MALIFSAFFIFAVLSHFAKADNLDCPVHRATTTSHRTQWGTKTIYAVQVCVDINWPVKKCLQANESFVSLDILHSNGTHSIIEPFMPAEVGKRFCTTYDPCRIAGELKGFNLAVANMSASAQVCAFDDCPDKQRPSLSLFILANPREMKKEGETRFIEHEVLSVLCPFPKCTIQSEGYGGDAKYYFKETETNQAPLCVEKGNSTFSVTQFVCDPKCSREYTAMASDVEAPPRPPSDCDEIARETIDGDEAESTIPTDGGLVPETIDGDEAESTIPTDGGLVPETTPTDGGVVSQPTPTDGGVVSQPPPTGGGVVSQPPPTDGGGVSQPPTDGDEAAEEAEPSEEKAAAAADTTKPSNALSHLSAGTIFTIVILALLA